MRPTLLTSLATLLVLALACGGGDEEEITLPEPEEPPVEEPEPALPSAPEGAIGFSLDGRFLYLDMPKADFELAAAGWGCTDEKFDTLAGRSCTIAGEDDFTELRLTVGFANDKIAGLGAYMQMCDSLYPDLTALRALLGTPTKTADKSDYETTYTWADGTVMEDYSEVDCGMKLTKPVETAAPAAAPHAPMKGRKGPPRPGQNGPGRKGAKRR
jgi:hypothetical protein